MSAEPWSWPNKHVGGGRLVWRSDDGSGDTYSISDGGGWLPGIYADEATAREAFEYEYVYLQALSDRICVVVEKGGEGRAITSDDLVGESK